MRTGLAFYLFAELLSTLYYCWRYWVWHGWETIGPHAFPSSPDAHYLYFNAQADYFLGRGLMIGLLLGGVVIATVMSRLQGVHVTRIDRILRNSVVLLPAFVLLCGYLSQIQFQTN